MIQKILYKKKLLAMIVQENKFYKPGVKFITPNNLTLQLYNGLFSIIKSGIKSNFVSSLGIFDISTILYFPVFSYFLCPRVLLLF